MEGSWFWFSFQGGLAPVGTCKPPETINFTDPRRSEGSVSFRLVHFRLVHFRLVHFHLVHVRITTFLPI